MVNTTAARFPSGSQFVVSFAVEEGIGRLVAPGPKNVRPESVSEA
jgi:hypothetical protein